MPVDICPEWLRHVREVIEKRRHSYSACVQTTISRRADSGLTNLLTKFEFLQQESQSTSEWVHDYGDVVIARSSMPVAAGVGAVEGIHYKPVPESADGKESGVCFADALIAFAKVRWSHSEWTAWPADITTLAPSSSGPWAPSASLVSREGPYFTSLGQVLNKYFTVRPTEWQGQFNGQIVVICPDFRARMTTLRVAGDSFRVEIEPGTLPTTELVLKVVAEHESGQLEHVSIDIQESVVEHQLEAKPSFLSVALISRIEHDLLQEKTFRAGALQKDPGVELDGDLPAIEQLCLIGEGETVEFKRQWADTSPEKLAKTVVAFANTKGGTIAFGVDDEQNIIGCDTQGLAERVSSVVGSRCDPPPLITIREVSADDKRVLLVRVFASDDVVHVARDSGPYIRANRNNRRPGAIELANLFRRRGVGEPAAW